MSGMRAPSNPATRREANAYAVNQRNILGWKTVIIIVAILFILRNVLVVDYKKATVAALKDGGKSDADIERLVPSLRSTKNKEVDYGHLAKDVAMLKSEVEELKAMIEGNTTVNISQNATENALSKR